jgi:hypothetical protein
MNDQTAVLDCLDLLLSRVRLNFDLQELYSTPLDRDESEDAAALQQVGLPGDAAQRSGEQRQG